MVVGTGITTSLILLATGAILAFAVDYQTSGIDIAAVGGILMVVGIIGFVLSLLPMAGFGSLYGRGPGGDHMHGTTTRTYVDEVPPARPGGNVVREERRTTVEERDHVHGV
jgi:hypothetical protein